VNILVTGGTGTLGRAIVKHLLTFSDTKIRVLARNEYLHWEMQQEIKDSRVRHLIGDIRDKSRLELACRGVEHIIHCAAMKHVSFCEYNPIEAVKTNVDGSVNLVEAAIACDVARVIAVSSDKAVYPVNIYGATKLSMEKIILGGEAYSGSQHKTLFSVVRMPNFFGSSGSVAPKWDQEKSTGRITVTDPNAKRYFLTVEDSALFVVQCLRKMSGGEVFIPKVSQIRMGDMADIIAPGCEHNITGLGEGEKMEEAMFTIEESKHLVEEGECLILR
jgi:UDP-N-acetylglucosamine 4,6-dehydratase